MICVYLKVVKPGEILKKCTSLEFLLWLWMFLLLSYFIDQKSQFEVNVISRDHVDQCRETHAHYSWGSEAFWRLWFGWCRSTVSRGSFIRAVNVGQPHRTEPARAASVLMHAHRMANQHHLCRRFCSWGITTHRQMEEWSVTARCSTMSWTDGAESASSAVHERWGCAWWSLPHYSHLWALNTLIRSDSECCFMCVAHRRHGPLFHLRSGTIFRIKSVSFISAWLQMLRGLRYIQHEQSRMF